METKLNFFSLMLLMLMSLSCGVAEKRDIWEQGSSQVTKPAASAKFALTESSSSLPEKIDLASLYRSLDELAELERTGAWIKGMAFRESGLRENAGDFAGAVAAAYKELSWAYGLGSIQKDDTEKGLLNLLASSKESAVVSAVNAVIAFSRGDWNKAGNDLTALFNEYDEPDCFGRWMTLVCSLEKNIGSQAEEDRRTASAYRSIRARYAPFPEYWYRGARAFSGMIAADYAENCINASAQGPFADECRKIIASNTGLKTEDGLSIKTKKEIDALVALSVNSGNPLILDSLLPLIALPDNPYTVYAVGVLKSLNGVTGFWEYFSGQAAASSGRLAERLTYICRG